MSGRGKLVVLRKHATYIYFPGAHLIIERMKKSVVKRSGIFFTAFAALVLCGSAPVARAQFNGTYQAPGQLIPYQDYELKSQEIRRLELENQLKQQEIDAARLRNQRAVEAARIRSKQEQQRIRSEQERQRIPAPQAKAAAGAAVLDARAWVGSSVPEQMAFLLGFHEALGIVGVDELSDFFAGSLSYAELREGIDRFYATPENGRIPIAFALKYLGLSAWGMRQSQVDQLIERARERYQVPEPPQNDHP